MIGATGLKNLRVDCIVGVYPHEREQTQALFLDLALDYDFGQAAESDAIRDAVDYDDVAASVTTLIQTRRFQLIETMAEATAAMLLERLPTVRAVHLTITKPAAVPAAECSYVRVTRERS